METLGSLCDKLTIVKLKQYHTDNADRLASLNGQATQLQCEIDDFIYLAVVGEIPNTRLTFPSNKVYDRSKTRVAEIAGTMGAVFAQLADANCRLWHEQEKVHESFGHDGLLKRLSELNLERTACIDRIDSLLAQSLTP